MSEMVKISDELVKAARARASVEHRTVAGQIEHWALLGQIAEDNPDLPLAFIDDVLIGLSEYEAGQVEELSLDVFRLLR